jgi:hypothetical protein
MLDTTRTPSAVEPTVKPRTKHGLHSPTWKPRSRHEISRYSGCMRPAYRIRTLAKQFRNQLGAIADHPAVKLRILRAAELAMLAEDLRAQLIRGEKIDVGNLLRLEAIADRALRQLGLDHLPHDDKSVPSISEYLAGIAAEEEAVEAAQARSPPPVVSPPRTPGKRTTGRAGSPGRPSKRDEGGG